MGRGPWPIPADFEQLVRDHIKRTRGEERDHLLMFDFPSGQAVRIAFPDGSFAFFEHAFFIEDRARSMVAVFTEHCGYHVFNLANLKIDRVRTVYEPPIGEEPAKGSL